MSVQRVLFPVLSLVSISLLASACGSEAKTPTEDTRPEPVAVATVTVESRAIERYLRVTGSLAADEQAEVSAETAGRVVATPVERGSSVAAGDVLVRISAAETSAQLQEAEANAGQIEARLGLAPGQTFDAERVPDVRTAKSSVELAEAEFQRIESLLEQKVVSRSEYDQRRAQVDSARQQYQAARNAAEQSYRALEAARARVALARKSVADTTVRAPFAGLVAERVVSVGDYVTRGTRVATVVRIDPMRVELTIPEQAVSLVKVGQPVRLTVDAYPGEEFTANVRFVSPSLAERQRALTVEAVAANRDGRLKPGLFATASIQQTQGAPALLIPANAVETVAGTSRVYVLESDKVEERIVTIGQTAGDKLEVTSGVAQGEVVALDPRGKLTDGMPVRVK
jgi:RND family efflux transporter MFP subunit